MTASATADFWFATSCSIIPSKPWHIMWTCPLDVVRVSSSGTFWQRTGVWPAVNQGVAIADVSGTLITLKQITLLWITGRSRESPRIWLGIFITRRLHRYIFINTLFSLLPPRRCHCQTHADYCRSLFYVLLLAKEWRDVIHVFLIIFSLLLCKFIYI